MEGDEMMGMGNIGENYVLLVHFRHHPRRGSNGRTIIIASLEL